MTEEVLGWLIGIAIALILAGFIGLMLVKIYSNTHQVVYEMKDSENDPYLKYLADCRSNFIDNLIHTIQDAWHLPDKAMHEAVCCEQLGDNCSLVTIPYKNNLVRFYIYWKRNYVRVTHISNDERKETIRKLKLRIKQDAVDLEKLYKFFAKRKAIRDLTEEEKNKIVEKMRDQLSKMSREEQQEWVLKQWEELRDLVDTSCMIEFAAVTTTMLIGIKEPFEQYLEQREKDHR